MNKKGKFQQPRKRSNAELEEAFQTVTAAANSQTVYQDTTSTTPTTQAKKKQNGRTSQQKKIAAICISVVAALLLVAIGVGTWWYLDLTKDDGLIYTNVSALGIDLSGMTPEQATAALEQAAAGYSSENITVHFPNYDMILAPSETQARVDVAGIVEAAYSYGRTGSRWENYQARTAAALTSYTVDIASHLTLDTTYIMDMLEQAAAAAASELTETTVTVNGTVPLLDRTYDSAIGDSSVQHMSLTIVMGTPYTALDVQAAYSTILGAYISNDFSPITISYAVTEPAALDLEALYAANCTEPIDAILNEETYDITREIVGYGFVIEELQAALDECQYGQTLEYPLGFLRPAVTQADLEAHLFVDVLASVSTNHTNIPNRTNNLKLACQAINGTIIKPGAVFSFNRIVGERTAAKGYKEATVYVSGASVPQLGGGICQVASTIYYAALLADLEITARTEHMYAVDYVPLGMDATIYWGSLDFKFTNNTDYPIRVEAWVSGGQVHVKLVGTDTRDYYVKMIYEVTDGPHYGATKYKVFAEDNQEGYKDGDVVQTAYTGRTVKTYRCYYSKDTGKLLSTKYEDGSTYAKRDKIICIIGDPTAPTDADGRPIETTTAPTAAPTTEPTTAPPTEAATEATEASSPESTGTE